mmetsp:Transcript_34312/g.75060  ORF Transcript_34312/g.75060 Transcript_34312/m.75060 type:complete len:240 (+) Transcript_34312:440-1159(+)
MRNPRLEQIRSYELYPHRDRPAHRAFFHVSAPLPADAPAFAPCSDSPRESVVGRSPPKKKRSGEGDALLGVCKAAGGVTPPRLFKGGVGGLGPRESASPYALSLCRLFTRSPLVRPCCQYAVLPNYPVQMSYRLPRHSSLCFPPLPFSRHSQRLQRFIVCLGHSAPYSHRSHDYLTPHVPAVVPKCPHQFLIFRFLAPGSPPRGQVRRARVLCDMQPYALVLVTLNWPRRVCGRCRPAL